MGTGVNFSWEIIILILNTNKVYVSCEGIFCIEMYDLLYFQYNY